MPNLLTEILYVLAQYVCVQQPQQSDFSSGNANVSFNDSATPLCDFGPCRDISRDFSLIYMNRFSF